MKIDGIVVTYPVCVRENFYRKIEKKLFRWIFNTVLHRLKNLNISVKKFDVNLEFYLTEFHDIFHQSCGLDVSET